MSSGSPSTWTNSRSTFCKASLGRKPQKRLSRQKLGATKGEKVKSPAGLKTSKEEAVQAKVKDMQKEREREKWLVRKLARAS